MAGAQKHASAYKTASDAAWNLDKRQVNNVGGFFRPAAKQPEPAKELPGTETPSGRRQRTRHFAHDRSGVRHHAQ
jgi:hypothetical protein